MAYIERNWYVSILSVYSSAVEFVLGDLGMLSVDTKKADIVVIFRKVGILLVNTSGDDDQFKTILARFQSILP